MSSLLIDNNYYLDRVLKNITSAYKSINEINGGSPRDYQVEVASAIFDSVINQRGDIITILISRQGGKNHTIIETIITLLTQCPGVKIGFYAPTGDQAKITSRRLRLRLKKMGFSRTSGLEVNNEKLIQFVHNPIAMGIFSGRGEGSMIGIYSHQKEASKEGQTWDIVIIDESQDLDDEVFDTEIEPMLASTNGTQVFIGTSWKTSCKFYKKTLVAKRARTHFEYPYTTVEQYSNAYKLFINARRSELGEDSISFRTQYKLEWIDELGKFFNIDQFKEKNTKQPAYATPKRNKVYCFGLDIGGDDPNQTGKSDPTELTILEVIYQDKSSLSDNVTTNLVYYKTWKGRDWDVQLSEVSDELRLWCPSCGCIDATGNGANLASSLKKSFPEVIIQEFKFSEDSKSKLGLYVETEFVSNRMTYNQFESDLHAKLLHQAENLEREALKYGKISFSVPSTTGHDDLIASWFLGVYAARQAKEALSSKILVFSSFDLDDHVKDIRSTVNSNDTIIRIWSSGYYHSTVLSCVKDNKLLIIEEINTENYDFHAHITSVIGATIKYNTKNIVDISLKENLKDNIGLSESRKALLRNEQIHPVVYDFGKQESLDVVQALLDRRKLTIDKTCSRIIQGFRGAYRRDIQQITKELPQIAELYPYSALFSCIRTVAKRYFSASNKPKQKNRMIVGND